MASIIEALARRAAAHPERPALIAGDRTLSYGELWGRACAVANHFAEQGLRAGDRILLSAPSTPTFAVGYLAAHHLGAVVTPLDPSAPRVRRLELTARTRPKLAYGQEAVAGDPGWAVRAIDELDALSPAERALTPPAPDALADLVFTTGTTGRPKGVRLTHGNIAAAARHINQVIGTREGDVEVVPIPLYHSFGLGRLRCALTAGATVVLVHGFRLPGEIFSALDKRAATGLVGVPAGFAVLLRFGARGLGAHAERLRYIEIGSAPMPIDHKRQLMELLPKTGIFMHYGLTEASRSTFIEFHRDRERLETIGKPAPGVEIEIRDDAGAVCPGGERGVLHVRGPHVSPGYWDDDDLTAAVFGDGYVRTGDVVHADAEGFLYLHGRKDDMVNVGGFNVAPGEVEHVLVQHPTVSEAACIGVPDPRGISGQILRAFLVAEPGQSPAADEELSRWVAAELESYKVPTQYAWVSELPRTGSGKLRRSVLRLES